MALAAIAEFGESTRVSTCCPYLFSFAIALQAVREPANARTLADKVLQVARTPFKINDIEVSIGASVGVAFGADPARGWAELVQRADAQLLGAKAGGKGQQQGASP